MKYLKNNLKYFFHFVIILFIVKCANQLPPGGGEVDTIPPKIIEIFPSDRTINYDKNFFEIIFSEYVDKRSVQEAIFISPPIAKGFKYDWSGKSLTVFFNDSLKTNTTYTITIGAEVQDINNRNKMIEPFAFSFSTGSKIDSGKISGKIYDDNPSGVMVYAYFKKDSTANPLSQKPDYISQVGKNGKFILTGLSNNKYNIFAVRDKYQDFLYQRNEDGYGVQSDDIVITDEMNVISDVNYFLSIEDTIMPKLSSVVMRDKNHFMLEFNEAIDSSSVTAQNFYLYDPTANQKIIPKYFFKGDARNRNFYLGIKDSLIEGNNISLHTFGIIDMSGNKSEEDIYSITVKNDPDTIPSKILKISSTLHEDKVDYDLPILSVKFDDGFEQENLYEAVKIIDDKNNSIPFELKKIDDASFNIAITKKIRQNAEYKLSIDLNRVVDLSGNKIDSVFTKKIMTASELEFSGVSGEVKNEIDSSNIYVVLTSATTEKKTYKQKIDSQKSFNIEKVQPGKYLLWSFVDRDKNQNYSNGSVAPLKYSEKFIYHPDTLNLRARWPVGDVIIRYK